MKNVTPESQIQPNNFRTKMEEYTLNNLRDLLNCKALTVLSHWTVFKRLSAKDTIDELFKSSVMLFIDCYPICVDRTSGSFRSVEQRMDFSLALTESCSA